jgi:hypothetical protein
MRPILTDQFEFLLQKLPSLGKIEISKIERNSWFSILWTPFKCSKQTFYNTSFLSYYKFSQNETENYMSDFTNHNEVPIIGVLPTKYDETIWLKKISKSKIFFYYILTFYFIVNIINFNFSTDMLDFRMTLNDSIVKKNTYILFYINLSYFPLYFFLE